MFNNENDPLPIAVINVSGKLVTESVVETSAATILGFLKGLRGQVYSDSRLSEYKSKP